MLDHTSKNLIALRHRPSILALALFGAVAPAGAATPARLTASADVGRSNAREVVVIAYPDIIWQCRSGGCSGSVDRRPVAMLRACKDIARKMSGVRGFKVDGRDFDAAELLECNAGKVVSPPA
ncbi:CC_3452 family protein [Sphingomonas albertensis]|uniref:Uncharacterized protein n=1 Tax=Sphingomonas albertensis TaxID=2762591 RepID=A0ABR7AJI0_9SPHN|nr:hypothetical protein [Sphingomonas albertensis]MBC3940613.1 hypothetical protein [Sphingomonas albertensis]